MSVSETTGFFEDDGRSRLFSLLFIAIKLPIFRISIFRKIQFFEEIPQSRLKKFLYITLQDSKSELPIILSCMVIVIVLLGQFSLHSRVI